jgi:hypothetical protein
MLGGFLVSTSGLVTGEPQVGANRFEALVAQALLSLSLTRPVLAVTPRKWGNELGLA